MEIKRICVFCGSSSGKDPAYAETAQRLGAIMAEQGLKLVYGGGSVGLMNVLANSVLDHGGEVIGVITKTLADMDVAHSRLTDLKVVDTMHERKALMFKLSHGFIAMPGGIGTLEELFEVLTWNQLGLHNKPCGLLDGNGYFEPLIQFLDQAVKEGFFKPEHQNLLMVEDSPEQLLDRFRTWKAPVYVEKYRDPR